MRRLSRRSSSRSAWTRSRSADRAPPGLAIMGYHREAHMTDMLIRDVPDDVIAAVEPARAASACRAASMSAVRLAQDAPALALRSVPRTWPGSQRSSATWLTLKSCRRRGGDRLADRQVSAGPAREQRATLRSGRRASSGDLSGSLLSPGWRSDTRLGPALTSALTCGGRHSPRCPWSIRRPPIEDRAVEVLTLLADRGQHRAPSIPDLLIAATAELAGLTVLHLDKDFEVIASLPASLSSA